MFSKIAKVVAVIALFVYAFEKGYYAGYKNRDEKFPEF